MQRADGMRWFHSLDLDGFQTVGRFPPHMPPNCTLFPAIDLINRIDVTGSECLDIGTANGLTAFGLEHKGGKVTATDILPSPSPCFSLAHEALGSSVDYQYNISLRDAPDVFGAESFDLVVCAGVMYHLLDPFDAIHCPRRLLRRDGFLVLETAFDPSATSPSMVLNPTATPLIADPYTYWIPSKAAVVAMLELFGFEIIAIRYILGPDRLAVLACSRSAEARQPDVPEQVYRVWEVGFQDPLAAEGRWMPEPSIAANIRGPERLEKFDGKIDVHDYKVDFPPHPIALTNVVGQSSWSDKFTNR